jgi:hypothetical protein
LSTANPEPGGSPTSYTGIDQVINPTSLIFCQKDSRIVCGALLQFMSVTSCASLAPVKSVPLKNCEDCASTQRKCEKVADGYQCVGVAQ